MEVINLRTVNAPIANVILVYALASALIATATHAIAPSGVNHTPTTNALEDIGGNTGKENAACAVPGWQEREWLSRLVSRSDLPSTICLRSRSLCHSLVN